MPKPTGSLELLANNPIRMSEKRTQTQGIANRPAPPIIPIDFAGRTVPFSRCGCGGCERRILSWQYLHGFVLLLLLF